MESDKLILDNLNLIYFVLQKMGLYNEREYYYDIGLIALVRAARQFDESKGYTFTTYATMAIRNEICVDMRRAKADKRKANFNTVSLDSVIYQNKEGDDITLMDTISSDINIEEELIEKERMKTLKNAITTLTIKERKVLKYYLMYDMSQRQIAEKIGCTQAHISRIYQRIIKKLQEKMKGE